MEIDQRQINREAYTQELLDLPKYKESLWLSSLAVLPATHVLWHCSSVGGGPPVRLAALLMGGAYLIWGGAQETHGTLFENNSDLNGQ